MTTTTTQKNKNRPATGYRPPVIHFTDEYGRKCVRVPLDSYGRNYAVALESDYHAVRAMGATGAWLLNSNGKGQHYVRTAIQDGDGGWTLVQVARLITHAEPRTAIYYVNKDRLDLRGENFFYGKNQRPRRCDVELAEHGARYRAERQRQKGRQQPHQVEHRAAA